MKIILGVIGGPQILIFLVIPIVLIGIGYLIGKAKNK
jgi:hypothetical protein